MKKVKEGNKIKDITIKFPRTIIAVKWELLGPGE